jgi:DeoR/GlpR family transcriptional regulator of sugar metabolism
MLERDQLILKELRINGRLSVEEMAARCQCSGITIRRALDDLQDKGLVVRTPGGAMAVDHVGVEVAFPERLTIHAEEKNRIAKKAAEQVKDHSVIMLDNGSSVYLMADFLGEKKGLTVITFFLPLVHKLAARSDWKIILAGGEIRPGRSDVVGGLTEGFLANIYADQFFFGADGLDVQAGISTVDSESARLTELLAKNSDRKILLADHSKLQKRATYNAVPWSSVDLWITNRGVEEDCLKSIRKKGVEIKEV